MREKSFVDMVDATLQQFGYDPLALSVQHFFKLIAALPRSVLCI